jgi:hypothetical protein
VKSQGVGETDVEAQLAAVGGPALALGEDPRGVGHPDGGAEIEIHPAFGVGGRVIEGAQGEVAQGGVPGGLVVDPLARVEADLVQAPLGSAQVETEPPIEPQVEVRSEPLLPLEDVDFAGSRRGLHPGIGRWHRDFVGAQGMQSQIWRLGAGRRGGQRDRKEYEQRSSRSAIKE